MGLATRLVHPYAETGDPPSAGLSPVLDRSATFRLDEAAERALATGAGAARENIYGRYGSDTLREVAGILAGLEGAESAVLFASGTAASCSILHELVPPGGTVAVGRALYGGTENLLRHELADRRVKVVRFDGSDAATLNRHLEAGVRPDLVWCECIANPLLSVADMAGISRCCHVHGVPIVVDNTFGAGIAARPLDRGADLVMHSATKFINGHSDVIGGVACGSAALMERIWGRMVRLGGCMDPEAAWLVARGVRTLPLRWARQWGSAAILADRLAEHSAVRRVHYPGRPDHDTHEVAQRELSGGGAMLAFEVSDGVCVRTMLDRLRVCTHATSLGGIETLLCVPARSSHANLDPAARSALGIVDGLVRVSVGIEDIEDLWDDLRSALEAR